MKNHLYVPYNPKELGWNIYETSTCNRNLRVIHSGVLTTKPLADRDLQFVLICSQFDNTFSIFFYRGKLFTEPHLWF